MKKKGIFFTIGVIAILCFTIVVGCNNFGYHDGSNTSVAENVDNEQNEQIENQNEFTVTFIEGEVIKIVTVNSGETITDLPFPKIPHNTYFGGWFTEIEGQGDEFTTETIVKSNLTVYAYIRLHLFEHEFVVSFFSGSEFIINIFVNHGETIADLPFPEIPTGISFGGWFTERNGNGEEFTTETIVVKHLFVYAYWESPLLLRIRQDAFDTFVIPILEDFIPPITVNDIWIPHYFGTYNGSVVVMINGWLGYGRGYLHYTVADVFFGWNVNQWPHVWRDGKFHHGLQEAYDEGWLNKNDLEEIAVRHNIW